MLMLDCGPREARQNPLEQLQRRENACVRPVFLVKLVGLGIIRWRVWWYALICCQTDVAWLDGAETSREPDVPNSLS